MRMSMLRLRAADSVYPGAANKELSRMIMSFIMQDSLEKSHPVRPFMGSSAVGESSHPDHS
jgi:hypothetical protein